MYYTRRWTHTRLRLLSCVWIACTNCSLRSCILLFCFRDQWSQPTQSKLVLKLLQSLCQTRCCIFNVVLAKGLIKYLCLSQSSNTLLTLAEWLGAPTSPLRKLSCVWMNAADICSDSKSLMKVNNPSGPEDGEKPRPLNEPIKWWMPGTNAYKSQNNADQMFSL